MEFKFLFYFSFSHDIEKRIWTSYFVFRFRTTLKNGSEFRFNFVFHFRITLKTDLNFVFRFRITLKNGFEFRFSFLYGFIIEKSIWISFVIFPWLEKRITAPVQSFEVPGHPLEVNRGIHFFCKWKQVNFSLPGVKVSDELLPPPMICLTHTVLPFLTMQWMTNDMMITAKKHAAIATHAYPRWRRKMTNIWRLYNMKSQNAR